jgi:hypothetical protein
MSLGSDRFSLRHDHFSDGPAWRQPAVANTMLAVLWFATTLAGFRAIRQHRFADHRQWMLRSVALAFSIVAYRVWLVIAFAVFVPEIYTGAEVDPATLDEAIGLTSWVSWVVNLLIVEWWLHGRPTGVAKEVGE